MASSNPHPTLTRKSWRQRRDPRSFSLEEAYELANVLVNPLEAPVKIEEEREVKASWARTRSAAASRLPPSASSPCPSSCWCTTCLAAWWPTSPDAEHCDPDGRDCSFDTTLTLPGIAGIVLTIGMAVDANVLIFERIREELAEGKSNARRPERGLRQGVRDDPGLQPHGRSSPR